MFNILFSDVAYAAAAQAQPSLFEMMILPLGFLFIMYFLMIRPQQRKSKEHQELIVNLKAGDEVITSGGMIGRIKSIADGFVTLEIASNISVKITKSSILALTDKNPIKPVDTKGK